MPSDTPVLDQLLADLEAGATVDHPPTHHLPKTSGRAGQRGEPTDPEKEEAPQGRRPAWLGRDSSELLAERDGRIRATVDVELKGKDGRRAKEAE